MYIVYSESFVNGKADRWFYGRYNDYNRANEIAIQLKCEMSRGGYRVFYCVCKASEAESFNIQNMPL